MKEQQCDWLLEYLFPLGREIWTSLTVVFQAEAYKCYFQKDNESAVVMKKKDKFTLKLLNTQ